MAIFGSKLRVFFFSKNVSRPSNPPDELAQDVSKKKKIPSGRIIPPFFLRKFRIWPFLNYLQDSNSIFRAAGINSEGFSGAQYADLFTISLRNDDIQEFDSKWDGILLSMTKIQSDDMLEGLYKLRIR